jgi:exonuclease III
MGTNSIVTFFDLSYVPSQTDYPSMLNKANEDNSGEIRKTEYNLNSFISNNHFDKASLTNENNLIVLHQNMRGLKSKINEFILSVTEIMPQLICISEHHVLNTDLNPPYIPNYNMGTLYSRSTFKDGGVCIYIHKDIAYTKLDLQCYCKEKDLEIAAIKFKLNKTSFIIYCVYRAPTGDLQYFFEHLEIILSSHSYRNTEHILCGDLNIDFLTSDYKKNQLIEILEMYNLHGIVNFPTRITHSSATLIDNIFIDKNLKYFVHPYINGLSDHDAQLLILPDIIKNTYSPGYVLKRCFDEECVINFQRTLSYELWDEIFNEHDVNIMFNRFLNIYIRCFNHSFPILKKSNYRVNQNQWITNGIIVSCKKKKELYSLYRITNNLGFRAYYKQYCVILKKVILNAKKMYYNDIIQKSNNKMKASWNIINNEKGKSKNKSNITQIVDEDIVITNHKQIANFFNNHFLTVANMNNAFNSNGHDQFRHTSTLCSIGINHQSYPDIIWHYASTHEIESIIRSLKTKESTGYDEISIRTLKLSLFYILSPLTYICNAILKQGYFPDRLKYACVIPIHKKGDVQNVNNYRPISLLTVFSKVIEKMIYVRLYKHLIINNILISNQFGFRTGHSAEQAIFFLINNVLEAIDKKQMVGGIFCDLHKAFDSVNYEILLDKTYLYGIRGNMGRLIHSYITNRYQKVVCKDNFSTWEQIRAGVPQGSILGPLLFLIYINDLPSAIEKKNNTVVLYADDTSVIITEPNPIDYKSHLNSLIEDISTWFKSNLLTLNLDKTQYLEFTPVKGLNRKEAAEIEDDHIFNSTLNTVENIKFLGITVDETLSWQPHIDILIKKMCSASYALRSLKHVLQIETLKMIYFAHVHSHLSYGIIFWGYSSKAIRVFIMQKKILRIMYNLKPRESCKEKFIQSQIMTFYSCYIYSLILFVVKNIKLFKFNNELHEHNTRTNTNLYPKNVRLSKVIKGPYSTGIRLFNHLPQAIKEQSHNVLHFKKILKIFFLKNPFYSIKEYLGS